MSIERPTITPELIRSAIENVLKEHAFSDLDDGAKANFADEIERHYYPGIEVGSLVGKLYDCDLSLDEIEALDGIGYQIDRLHKKVCERWVIESNIQPPFPVGELIEEGEITGLSDFDPATYQVKPYGQDDATSHQRRVLIKFENAKKVDVAPDNWVKHDPSQSKYRLDPAPLRIESADWLETLSLAVRGKSLETGFTQALYINRFDQIEDTALQKCLAEEMRSIVGNEFFNTTVHVLVNGGLIFINDASVVMKLLQCLMANTELKEAGLFVANFNRAGKLIATNE